MHASYWLKKILHPLSLYHLVFVILFFTNFPFGKFFLGWDSLNPEFNFLLNFTRVLTPFWQENYGLGTLGGHGFAATLPDTLVTFFTSFFLPQVAIRSFFTFLCLYLGGLGMYYFITFLFTLINNVSIREKHFTITSQTAASLALCSSLFYILNLGTVQIFSLQLETFIGQFAVLPWLFLSLMHVLKKSKHALMFFVLINFFATLQGFVPSLFAAYMIMLVIFLFVFVLHNKTAASIKMAVFIFLLTLLINAYWMLPLGYYQLTRGSMYLNAYNNLTTTQHFIDLNKKYGGITDVGLLKSYLFDAYELGGYIFQPWIAQLQNPVMWSIGMLFFLVVLVGFVMSLAFFRHWVVRAMAGIFAFLFISLATNVPPFSYIIEAIQTLSPLYAQAFRTAFTKFSIGMSFSYSIFFAFGILFFLILTKKYLKHQFIVFGSVVLLLILYAFPAFSGNFLYNKLKVTLPVANQQVMQYFQSQPDGRIADFPQDCSDGWYSYNWGYFGSGFYWYGIKQPVLSRSFDVWSNQNENYYWEVSQALHSQNPSLIDSILRKYDVQWVLFDPNLIYCTNPRIVLLNQAFISYLSSSQSHYALEHTYTQGVIKPIQIYKRKDSSTQSFISLFQNVPNIGPSYSFTNNDQALQANQEIYMTTPNQPYSTYYPYRSLFTQRKNTEKTFTLSTTDKNIIFSTTLPQTMQGQTLHLNTFSTTEQTIPVQLLLSPLSTTSYDAAIRVLYPTVMLDKTTLAQPFLVDIGTFVLPANDTQRILVNGIPMQKNSPHMYTGVFSFSIPNTIIIQDQQTGSLLLNWNDSSNGTLDSFLRQKIDIRLPSFARGAFTVILPKLSGFESEGGQKTTDFSSVNPIPCNEIQPSNRNSFEIGLDAGQQYIRMQSTNSSQCLNMYFPNLLTANGYLMETKTRSVAGRNLLFSVTNKEQPIYDKEYIYSRSSSFETNQYIIPPTLQSEIGENIQFNNLSEDTDQTINDFAGVSLWHIPYSFLTSLSLGETVLPENTVSPSQFTVSHPIETNYDITFQSNNLVHTTLVLAQGYDAAWKAYSVSKASWMSSIFPFFFGTEIPSHVLIDNWANGWNIPQISGAQTIIIMYMPEYIEYSYFVFLFLIFVWLLIYKTLFK